MDLLLQSGALGSGGAGSRFGVGAAVDGYRLFRLQVHRVLVRVLRQSSVEALASITKRQRGAPRTQKTGARGNAWQ